MAARSPALLRFCSREGDREGGALRRDETEDGVRERYHVPLPVMGRGEAVTKGPSVWGDVKSSAV